MFEWLGALSGVLSLAGEARQRLEYWRNYRGERIRIEKVSHLAAGATTHFQEVTYIIEGTVEDVMSFPPGFLLSDVEEYVSNKKTNDRSREGIRDTVGHPYNYNEKFIAFRDVDQLVFLEKENGQGD